MFLFNTTSLDLQFNYFQEKRKNLVNTLPEVLEALSDIAVLCVIFLYRLLHTDIPQLEKS